MRRFIVFLVVGFIFSGCTSSDYNSLARVVLSKNPKVALKSFATSKSTQYITNPKHFENDIKSIDKGLEKLFAILIGEATKEWGRDNVKTPSKKEYVKYLQNYKSRALVDFDKGVVTVESLDSKRSLKNAIVTTLLLPDDPRSVDLFSAKKIKLGATPYLLGEIKDDQGKSIRYSWRANRYAQILLKKGYKQKSINTNGKVQKIHYVQIPMEKDHADIRVKKFIPFVKMYAAKYNLSENLVYAIIKTESNFNQYAVSNVGAIGLMQVVPRSGGKDSYTFVKGRDKIPSRAYLFDAKNNIELGSAYLHIIDTKYLRGIKSKISREYCTISAYNTGSGNVLKVFSKNRDQAKRVINEKSPSAIYSILREKLPYTETRRYLHKVIENKKKFVNL